MTTASLDENYSQTLKSAIHHTVLKICQDATAEKGLELNRMVLSAITETTWRKCEEFATDLELFAKHAKRKTVNAEDVKLLVRKSPKLHQHIKVIHDEIKTKKAEAKKDKIQKQKNTVSTDASVE